jgi:hypothetical protein
MTWTPVDQPWVNESPHPARLGRGLDHETHQAHSRTDHPQAQNSRAADRPGQDRRRRLPGDRDDAADLPSLAAAPSGQGRLDRGGKAAPSALRDRSGTHPMEPADGLPPPQAGRLEREPQAGATALEGEGPATAHSQEEEAGSARRWLSAASPG